MAFQDNDDDSLTITDGCFGNAAIKKKHQTWVEQYCVRAENNFTSG